MNNNIVLIIWNEYARTGLMSLLSMAVGLQIQTTIMRKKRTLHPLIIYVVFKSMVDVFLLDGLLQRVVGGTREGQIMITTISLCLTVGMAMMYVYTFHGKAIENIIGIIISETIMTLVWMPCVLVVNYLGQRKELFTFYGQIQAWDLLLFPLAILVPQIFLKLAGSILRRYRTFQFPHRKLFWGVIVVYILVGQSIIFFGGQESNLFFAATMYMVHLLISAGIMGGIYVVYRKYQNKISQEHEFLQMQIRLMEAHYTALWRQIRKMEEGQRLVDQQMELLMKKENDDQRIASYLQELRSEYDRIQAGVYCEDWQVDAVLYCQAETAKRQGIHMDCSLQNYKRGRIPEDVIAALFYQLLEIGLRENMDGKCRADQGKDKNQITLKAGTVKNVLIVQFGITCSNSRKISVKTIEDQIQEYGEISELHRKKGELQLVLAMPIFFLKSRIC